MIDRYKQNVFSVAIILMECKGRGLETAIWRARLVDAGAVHSKQSFASQFHRGSR